MDIVEPNFTTSQVATAAGMKPSNFRAHLARGNWRIIGKSVPASELGKGHSFTIYDALGFALAHQLVTFGVDPKVAFERAMFDFAHTGGEDRMPGSVFDVEKYGRTYYAYSPGHSLGHCVAALSIGDLTSLFYNNWRLSPDAIILIDLNDLRSRVFKSLGLDERDYD